MIDLLNKLLSRFNLQVVSKEELQKGKSFAEDITSPEFMYRHPDFLGRYIDGKRSKSLYAGEINYVQKNEDVYFEYAPSRYDEDNKRTGATLYHINGEVKDCGKITKEELAEKLKK
jgi:hypothetical protein